MIKPITPVSPAASIKNNQPKQYNGCTQPKKPAITDTFESSKPLTEQEQDAVISKDGNLDIDISKISSCSRTSMDDCKENCPRYYSCNTIAYANDILVKYEAGLMVQQYKKGATTCKTASSPNHK